MPNFDPNYDDTWTTTSVNASVIVNGNEGLTAEISNDGKQGTEVAVEVAYGATVTAGAKVFVLRDSGGTFETQDDNPWGFELARAASLTRRGTFHVPASSISKFKIEVHNPTGSSITVTVKYKQATTDQLN